MDCVKNKESFLIDYSRGTNICRQCSSSIEQGDLRFGAIVNDGKHTAFLFYHLDCVLPPRGLLTPLHLCGIEAITPADVRSLELWIAETERESTPLAAAAATMEDSMGSKKGRVRFAPEPVLHVFEPLSQIQTV